MKLNESTTALRRVGPIQVVDANGDPLPDFSGVAIGLSVNDAVFGAGAGGLIDIGDGYAYYQGTVGDASVEGFIAIKLTGDCQEVCVREEVESAPQGIAVGGTGHLGPLRLIDGNGDPVISLFGVTTEVSVNGAAWAAPLGITSVIESGYADYEPAGAELTGGWIAVRLTGAVQEVVFRCDVVEVAVPTEDLTAPTVSLVSPDEDTEPGVIGGFPKKYSTAKSTPVVIDLTDNVGISYAVVVARFYADVESANPDEEVAYRGDNFRGAYVASSFKATVSGGVRLSLVRAGGWPSNTDGTNGYLVIAVDVTDTAGTTSNQTFTFTLPPAVR